MLSQETDHVSPTEVIPELGKGALDTWRPHGCLGGRLDKTGDTQLTVQGGEAVGKPGGVGADTHQRLNLSKPWEGPRRICQDFKPYSGDPTVRHYRGASGNVRHGEIVTPSRDRKSENGNPSPTAGRARILSRPRERTLGLTNLVWGDFCQGGAQRVLSIFSCLRVSLFDLSPFLRPDPTIA
jgi:hypothetical protein